jgi:signal transduction histidine kinase
MKITSAQDIPTYKRIYLLIGLLSILIAGVMGYGFYTATHIINTYTPLIHSADEIQKNVTTSHLWLEEMLSGDSSENADHIRMELSRAEQYINAMLNGSGPRKGMVTPIDEVSMRSSMTLIQDSLNQIKATTEERIANFSTSGAGTLVDNRYDALFEAFIYQSDEMENRVHALIARDMARFQSTQIILITCCVALFIFFGMIIYSFEKKQRNNIHTLRTANDSLFQEEKKHKQLANELTLHRNNLEKIIDERTAEVKQALIAAEQSSQAKSEFLSCMSHELRTPLHAVLGFAQLLEIKDDSPLTDTDRDHIQEILHGGMHLLELINDILDLSRIESGNIDIALENINLNELLSTCIAMTKPMADKQGIHLIHNTPPDSDMVVNIDRRRFKQVILNLLSNAVKYNTANGSVTLSSQILDSGYIRVIVKDDGLGIDHQYQRHIFEPFIRAPSKRLKIGGTGIGLTITKQLIEAMNGSIDFKSTPGNGSDFWVDIPLSERTSAQVASL